VVNYYLQVIGGLLLGIGIGLLICSQQTDFKKIECFPKESLQDLSFGEFIIKPFRLHRISEIELILDVHSATKIYVTDYFPVEDVIGERHYLETKKHGVQNLKTPLLNEGEYALILKESSSRFEGEYSLSIHELVKPYEWLSPWGISLMSIGGAALIQGLV